MVKRIDVLAQGPVDGLDCDGICFVDVYWTEACARSWIKQYRRAVMLPGVVIRLGRAWGLCEAIEKSSRERSCAMLCCALICCFIFHSRSWAYPQIKLSHAKEMWFIGAVYIF